MRVLEFWELLALTVVPAWVYVPSSELNVKVEIVSPIV